MKRCMCQLPNIYRPGKIPDGEWFGISRKANGVHAIFLDGKLYSRERKVMKGVNHILEECWLLNSALGGTPSTPFVIEGEVILNGVDFIDEFDCFSKTVGILNDTRIKEKPELTLKLFDAITIEEYYNHGVNTDKYSMRKQRLLSAYNGIADECSSIMPVDFLYEGTDQSEIEKWFEYSQQQGWEGIVINRDTPYARSKNDGSLKYKHVNTVDIPIVDFKPGCGRYKGMLGALIVRYKGTDVKVGTGMSYEFREWAWAHRPELLNRVVEIKFQCTTRSKFHDGESLQFPVFVCLRDEGKEINEDG